MSGRTTSVLIILAALLAGAGCGREPPAIKSAEFSPGQIAVTLNAPVGIVGAELLDSYGRLTASAVFPSDHVADNVVFRFQWIPRGFYKIVVHARSGSVSLAVQAPGRVRSSLASFQFPFGMESDRAVAPAGAVITGNIVLNNDSDHEKELTVSVTFPPGFEPAADHGSFAWSRTGELVFNKTPILRSRYDSANIQIKVKSPDQPEQEPRAVSLKVMSRSLIIYEKTVLVRVIAPSGLESAIRIKGVRFPTDEEGLRDPRLQENALNLSAISRLKSLVTGTRGASVNYREVPYTHFAVTLENGLDEDAIILVRASVVNPLTGEKQQAFAPEAHINPVGEIYSTVRVRGQSRQDITLPFYVEPRQVPPGAYEIKLGLTLFGAEVPFASRLHPLRLIKQPMTPMLVTMAGSILALVFITGFLVFFKRIYGGYKVRWIILISLYGAVGFVVVNLPGTVLWDLFNALLGPFSFLASGLFYGVLQYMLWASLLTLVPMFGAMSLAIAVRLLLSWLMLGNVSVVMLIWMGCLAVVMESFLWLSGATRRRPDQTPMTPSAGAAALEPARRPRSAIPAMVLIVMAFAAADTVSTFFNLESTIFLFRLYYAGWYIAVSCLINGIVYTSIGSVLGLKLGARLGSVVE